MRNRARTTRLTILLLVAGFSAPVARAASFFTEQRITDTTAWETTVSLGADAAGAVAVYAVRDRNPDSSFGPADLYYRRLTNGAPSGPAIGFTDPATDDRINDISGNFIVYTAYDAVGSNSGRIMLYNINTAVAEPIDSGLLIDQPRINGKNVVWSEGEASLTRLMLFDTDWLSSGDTAIQIAGTDQPIGGIDIGDRFVAWSEFNGSDYDIRAYDLQFEFVIDMATFSGVDETAPSTEGPWVFFQRQGVGLTESTIDGTNLDTWETRTIAANGAMNYRPRISNDVVLYETDITGDLDVMVYYLDYGMTAMVVDDTLDNTAADLYGRLTGYVDRRYGTDDLFATLLPASVCCMGTVGNVDNDPTDDVNISDLTLLVSILFQGAAPPACEGEANVDAGVDGSYNISDVTYLVGYLFQGGPEPRPCDPAGDAIDPALPAEWEITAATFNGISLPVADVLDFEPGAVTATYTLTADGHYLYREKDASQATVWSEAGLYGMAGEYAVSRHTTTNGAAWDGGYQINRVAVDGPTMTLTTIEEGNVIVFTLTR